jgi:hypothetical protein
MNVKLHCVGIILHYFIVLGSPGLLQSCRANDDDDDDFIVLYTEKEIKSYCYFTAII